MVEDSIKLIVGLGNPGRVYSNNRHNIGFICLNYFARKHSIRFDKRQSRARIGMGKVANNEVVVAKPQTYMNLSGQAVSLLVKKFNINLNNLLVIHDDLDLPLGKIRIRRGVGWTGHKGVRSSRDELGSGDFSLLRVGIGRPVKNEDFTEFSGDEVIAYVLSDFTTEEKQILNQVMPTVSDAILCIFTEGPTAAMNKYN